MRRISDFHLLEWANRPNRKPLLLRGARQVGKTYAARNLGNHFPNLVEINLESQPNAREIFNGELEAKRLIRELSLIADRAITPGQTLLFLDEIQEAPRAVTALRYLYEQAPDLHVIAAGSLLDFSLQEVGIPVGRVESLYLYPLSFLEFLVGTGHHLVAEEIVKNTPSISEAVHGKILRLLGVYLAVGGMPEAVKCWAEQGDPFACSRTHHSLLDTYRQDFHKYAKEKQVKYVELLFNYMPEQLGRKFKYTQIPGDWRKRELAPCLDLLITAGIAHVVTHSAGHGVPLGAEARLDRFKCLGLDVALSQAVLGLDLAEWFLNPTSAFVNKGQIVEAFIGHELLAYANPERRAKLFYWQREARNSQAEVDYLHEDRHEVIPIEVKSGAKMGLQSLYTFLDERPETPYGLLFSPERCFEKGRVRALPLYSVATLFDHEWLYELVS